MIVKMMKYSLILLDAEKETFIERLRELGMVDITTTGWDPSDSDRALFAEIEGRQKALEFLSAFQSGEDYVANQVAPEGDIYSNLLQVQSAITRLNTEKTRLEKLIQDWAEWGDFEPATFEKLSQGGLNFRFFVVSADVYAKLQDELKSKYDVYEVANDGQEARIVVISSEDVVLDALEMKLPSESLSEMKASLLRIEEDFKSQYLVVSAIADSKAELEADMNVRKVSLQDVKIVSTAEAAVDGRVLVLEGWAEEATSARVDELLDTIEGVYYIKQKPTQEDDTPVKLKNNKFATFFELIGAMYAFPKYGTVDLTPFFAPFYMLFFAICLNDAGYGLMIFLLGLYIRLRMGDGMKQAAGLSMFCGGATVLFGLYTGSLFGMSIPEMMGYPSVKESPFLDFQGSFFSIAMAIGVIQILLAMAINIIFTATTFGFRQCLGSLGWFMLIFAGCLAGGLPVLNEDWVIPFFTTDSVAFQVVCGIALVLMLFLNSPDKNIFANFGKGLWDTYNNITGLLSDVLSYIRLFAIGLSGGVLALVFNSLALGLTGLSDGIEGQPIAVIILKVIGATAILLVGHGINLFMSAISSFVHPMRLTFVEFYKNAGFESTTRLFNPIKK